MRRSLDADQGRTDVDEAHSFRCARVGDDHVEAVPVSERVADARVVVAVVVGAAAGYRLEVELRESHEGHRVAGDVVHVEDLVRAANLPSGQHEQRERHRRERARACASPRNSPRLRRGSGGRSGAPRFGPAGCVHEGPRQPSYPVFTAWPAPPLGRDQRARGQSREWTATPMTWTPGSRRRAARSPPLAWRLLER